MPYIFNTNAIKTASIALPDKKLAAERPMLDAIHIFDANESRFYEATNGHIAICVKTERPDEPEVNFALKFADAFFKDKSLPPVIEGSVNENGDFTFKGTLHAALKSDIPFPNTERVLYHEGVEPASRFSMFDPDLLKRAQKALGVKHLPRPLQRFESDPAFWIKGDILVAVMPYKI